MTVFENIAFGLRVRPRERVRPSERQIRARQRTAGARPAGESGGPLSVAAFGRPAPARGAGARAGGRAERAAAGRAFRRARRQGAQGTAPLAAPASRRGQHHQRLRHPRPGGGARSRRPGGGHERGHASSRSARPTRSTITPPRSFVYNFLGNVNLFHGRDRQRHGTHRSTKRPTTSFSCVLTRSRLLVSQAGRITFARRPSTSMPPVRSLRSKRSRNGAQQSTSRCRRSGYSRWRCARMKKYSSRPKT